MINIFERKYIKFAPMDKNNKKVIKHFFNVNLKDLLYQIALNEGLVVDNVMCEKKVKKLICDRIRDNPKLYNYTKVSLKEFSTIIKPRKLKFTKNAGIIIAAIFNLLKECDCKEIHTTICCKGYSEEIYAKFSLSHIYLYINQNHKPVVYQMEIEFCNNCFATIHRQLKDHNVSKIFSNINEYDYINIRI